MDINNSDANRVDSTFIAVSVNCTKTDLLNIIKNLNIYNKDVCGNRNAARNTKYYVH